MTSDHVTPAAPIIIVDENPETEDLKCIQVQLQKHHNFKLSFNCVDLILRIIYVDVLIMLRHTFNDCNPLILLIL